MSSHLHAEMIRARQHEIAARTAHAHHRHELLATTGRPRPAARSRVGRAVAAAAAAAGLGLALTTATGAGAAHASLRSAQAPTAAVTRELSLGHATAATAGDPNSARQYQRDISTLEAKGYAQALCTVDGMLMFNWRTGRLVTVSW